MMINRFQTQSGYVTLAQLGFFLAGVVAITIGMTHYAQKGIKGAYRDAAHYSRDYVLSQSSVTDMRLKYQPYYVERTAVIEESSTVNKNSTETPAATLDTKNYNEFRQTTTESRTLPPAEFGITE